MTLPLRRFIVTGQQNEIIAAIYVEVLVDNFYFNYLYFTYTFLLITRTCVAQGMADFLNAEHTIQQYTMTNQIGTMKTLINQTVLYCVEMFV